MIPKIIHYCWFGGKEEPEDVKKCIRSWKKYCPDYQIVRWDESNFDLDSHVYMREAYERKMWAFVSDLARLKIIYENGGIYLDTDVELIKSLDGVLDNNYFLGIECDTNPETKIENINIATGLGFGAEKGNKIIADLISEYDGIHFVNDGKTDTTPCPVRNTNALKKYGFKCINETQSFEGGVIYASDFFCPIESGSNIRHFTDNTISIHHYNASWKSWQQKFIYNIRLLKRKTIAALKNQ